MVTPFATDVSADAERWIAPAPCRKPLPTAVPASIAPNAPSTRCAADIAAGVNPKDAAVAVTSSRVMSMNTLVGS